MNTAINPEWLRDTNKIWHHNLARARYWGAGLTGYWGLLVLLATINNWSSRLYPRATLVIKSRFASYSPVRFIHGHLTIPSLFPRGKHFTYNLVGGIFPTRFESLVLFLYFALVFIGESVNYETNKHNVYWPHKSEQLARYVGDRTAIISMFIIIPTYLFAGRNNFLLWLTGWRQSTFLTFHKWLARMAVVSSLVHTFTMLLNCYWMNSIHITKYTQYWRCGSVAIIIGVIMVVQSLPFLRRNWYEIFLYGHIILAVFFLIGVWIHVATLGYGPYAYATAAVWAFDRFVRSLKLISFGIKNATVSIVNSKNLLVVIDDDTQIWNKTKPKPGSFGYLYFLSGTLSWFQSHPFSIITLEKSKAIAFYITVKNGLTKKIYNDLMSEPSGTTQMKIMLEGFYGQYRPVYAYDYVMMFTTGTGAVSPVEYLKEITNHNNNNIHCQKVKYVKFYWIVPDLSHTSVLARELSKLKRFDYVHFVIYATRQQELQLKSEFTDIPMNKNGNSMIYTAQEMKEVKNDSSFQDTSSNICSENSELELACWSEIHCRSKPDLSQLLRDDLRYIPSSNHVAVVTCGHPVVCDQIRNVVAGQTSLRKGKNGALDLIELLQIW